MKAISVALRVAGMVTLLGPITPVWAQATTVGEQAGTAPSASSAEAVSAEQRDIEDLDLESLLTQSVVSSTKMASRSAEAPAIISSVSREEIQLRGYTSVAEILRTIPGFYDVWDLVTHNVGVRGISGGAGASGNVLKLMIDGHPVDFRPTTGNFFGEELIPLEAIERIEVIRGPASALYGANAFLGVINIITRSGASVHGFRVTGQAGSVAQNPAGGAGVLVGDGTPEGLDLLLAAQGHFFDRSGLELPPSSPALARGDAPAGAISSGDYSRPRSFLGKASVPLAGGTFRVLGALQQLDSGARFQGVGLVDQDTRIAVLNQNYRFGWERALGSSSQLRVSAQHFRAEPTSRERFDVGRPSSVLVRDVGVDGYGADAELELRPLEPLSVLLRMDYVRERQRLQAFGELLTEDVYEVTVLRQEGTLIPGEGYGETRTFTNLGFSGQLIYSLGTSWTAVAGGRADRHNIYGVNPSWRAGVVFAPPERPLSLKVLYGSSFKAPSAEQLYTRPREVGDVLGNPDLQPQRADTVEVSFGHALGERGEVQLNLFAMKVEGRVEFLRRGLYLLARNQVNESLTGGELELRARLLPNLRGRLTTGVAKSLSRSEQALSAAQTGETPLYPMIQVHGLLEYQLPWAGLRLTGEASWIGERDASQSNSLLTSSAYSLPAHVYTAVALALPEQALLGDRLTRVSLRVRDVLNTAPAEPGFGGVDVPSVGRSFMLTFVQEL